MSANFERATRESFRFDTAKGLVSVEDLWALPLTSRATNGVNLDDIAKKLHRALNQADEVSFVRPAETNRMRDKLQAEFDIVKHIIDVKMAERDAAAERELRAAKKQKLMDVISRKQDAALEDASVEDLQKMLNDL